MWARRHGRQGLVLPDSYTTRAVVLRLSPERRQAIGGSLVIVGIEWLVCLLRHQPRQKRCFVELSQHHTIGARYRGSENIARKRSRPKSSFFSIAQNGFYSAKNPQNGSIELPFPA